MSLKTYIKNRKVKHFSFYGVEIYVKDEITNGISIRNVLKGISQRVPLELIKNIDSIYVGQFDFLKNREVQAMYENSSIFVTNEQDTALDMIDDIIHEIAHSTEEIFGSLIYSDRKIEKEFLKKREKLWSILDKKGYNVDLDDFLAPEFSYEFDSFLYQEVGYPMLATLTTNIFYSPYAATSIKEYYANGFEAFFLKDDISRLKKISPQLYRKLVKLITTATGGLE